MEGAVRCTLLAQAIGKLDEVSSGAGGYSPDSSRRALTAKLGRVDSGPTSNVSPSSAIKLGGTLESDSITRVFEFGIDAEEAQSVWKACVYAFQVADWM